MNGMFIFLLLILMVSLPLIAIKPNTTRHQAMKPFTQTIIAHRGLFDNAGDAPENSLPAFEKAVAGGYGIELDVQLSADGIPMVHHDFTLKRLSNDPSPLVTKSALALKRYTLGASHATIPTFQEVLDLVAGQVPLVIEIKTQEENWRDTTEKVVSLLEDYQGLYCIEAFDPRVLWWLKRHHPTILRGILSTNFFKSKKEMTLLKKVIATHLLSNFLIKPDFIAYNYRYQNQPFYWLCRKLYRPVNAAWTVRDHHTLQVIQKNFQIAICDGFLPDEIALLKH